MLEYSERIDALEARSRKLANPIASADMLKMCDAAQKIVKAVKEYTAQS